MERWLHIGEQEDLPAGAAGAGAAAAGSRAAGEDFIFTRKTRLVLILAERRFRGGAP